MISSLQVQRAFVIAHASDVAMVRRHGVQLADSLGFTETQSGKLAVTISELATNIVKHAGDGIIFISAIQQGQTECIQILALDKGPGIADIAYSMRDGISTANTAGNGLGAIKRLSNEFDAYSAHGKGSAFYALIHAHDGKCNQKSFASVRPECTRLQYGMVCIPVAGEEECGDAWAVTQDDDCITFLVADGLGHGPDAAVASRAAVRTLESKSNQTPVVLIHAMHQALRTTRGAALAIGQYQFNSATLNFAGIGNITACLVEGETRKQLVSYNGTVGHNMRKVQDFTVPWPQGALYIMCSDGISTQWDLSHYPGLIACHPALVAGIIYRDFTRGRDDATIVVARKIYH